MITSIPDARQLLVTAASFPIVFVVIDAFTGTVLNFRNHASKMPRPGYLVANHSE